MNHQFNMPSKKLTQLQPNLWRISENHYLVKYGEEMYNYYVHGKSTKITSASNPKDKVKPLTAKAVRKILKEYHEKNITLPNQL